MRSILTLLAALALLAPTTAWAQYGGDDGEGALDSTTVGTGGTVSYELPGWEPDSGGDIFLLSEPTDIGDFTADADGTAQGDVTIPEDAAAGDHTLEFRGTGADGTARTVSFDIVVQGEGGETGVGDELAATGSSGTGGMLRTAGLVLFVGLVLVGISVQRQRARQGRATRDTVGV